MSGRICPDVLRPHSLDRDRCTDRDEREPGRVGDFHADIVVFSVRSGIAEQRSRGDGRFFLGLFQAGQFVAHVVHVGVAVFLEMKVERAIGKDQGETANPSSNFAIGGTSSAAGH
jgi:hypothetical protein